MWKGPADLRALLVPIEEVEPHPDNPRRGNLAELEKALERFGQQKPIVVMDGLIYAGNHIWRAARGIGWDELAMVNAELSQSEARAYLLADNRTSDIAGYDPALMVKSLEKLRKLTGGMGGTGYSPEQVSLQLAELRRTAVDTSDYRPTLASAEHTCPRCGKTWQGDPRP